MTVTPLFAVWKPATQAAIAAVCAVEPEPVSVPLSGADDVLVIADGDVLVPAAEEVVVPDEVTLPAELGEADGVLPLPLEDEHPASPRATMTAAGIAARLAVERT